MEVLLGVGAALFFAVPLWMLYCSRQRRGGEEASQDGCLLMLLCGGWSVWAQASVVCGGTLHSLLVTVLLVWVWIMLANHFVPVPIRGAPSNTSSGWQAEVAGRPLWKHFLLMVVLASISGGLLIALILPGLPFELPSRLVLSVLLFPLLWSTLTLWACVDRITWRVPIYWLVLLACCAVFLWFQGQ